MTIGEVETFASAHRSPAEHRVVYLAGLVQGITLVTFPAASSILTDPDEYGLSSSQYGALFLPQVITAIAASLVGSRLAARLTAKRVLLIGLAANLFSMVVLVLSTAVSSDTQVAYPLLLLATAWTPPYGFFHDELYYWAGARRPGLGAHARSQVACWLYGDARAAAESAP